VLFPIWLVTHRELRTARRVRVVFDMLADALAAGPEDASKSNSVPQQPADASAS